MGLLDWFRPAWKHSSAQVRRDAVAAMTADDAAVLGELARRDPDVGVRKLALEKTDDPQVLAACADHDADVSLRGLATGRLDAVRLREALHAPDETRARLAIGRLRGGRGLVEVAMRAESAATRRAALDKIDDQTALLEVIRGATDGPLRAQALDRLQEPKLLKDLALHDAPRDLQLRAVERLEDLPSLELVAQRAQVKAVRSAAAARVRERKPQAPARDTKKDAEREADEKRARLLADAETRRRQELEAERARRDAETRRAREEATARREAETARAAVVDPVLEARKAEEKAMREAERARRDEERARRDAEKQKRDEERARRDAERAGDEQRVVATLEPAIGRLEAVLAESPDDRRALEDAVKAARDVQLVRGRVSPATEAVQTRFSDARNRASARLAELREAETWRRWANVPKFEALIKTAEAILAEEAARPEPSDARTVAAGLKVLHAEWKALGAAPREKADALWARFKDACDKIHARAEAGFAVLDEERVANLEKKKELCARAETTAEGDLTKETAAAVKALQEEWKAIGPVPKADADEIWKRFRGACDKFFERRKAAYAETEGERMENLATLQRLCGEAEGLRHSTEWRDAAERLKALQAEWREVGPAGRNRAEADDVWQRFRAACDAFFERRKAAFEEEDEKRAANLEKKQAVLARAEALAAGDEVADPDATIRGLMQEWKAIGHVPREHADELWAKFRDACDKIRNPTTETPQEPEPEGGFHRFQNHALEGLADKLKGEGT